MAVLETRSLVAIAVGSSVGIVVALAGREPPPAEPPPLAPAAARPIERKPQAPAAAPSSEVVQAAEAPPVAGEPLAGTERPIASRDELEAAAVACEAKDAGACRRAAAALDVGDAVPKDPARARTLRKIELTLLVRGCEKNAVEACLTLADRYLRGDGLEKSDRTATALIEHAREICARRPEDACRSIPSN